MEEDFKAKIFFIFLISVLFLPALSFADSFGQRNNFFVNSSYDSSARTELPATLRIATLSLNFYIDDNWWALLDSQVKQQVEDSLHALDNEFYSKIYPGLTSVFGFEWKPGIDKDDTITILIHPMKKGAGGYFSSGDEYPKALSAKSNEREMVYLNADFVTSTFAKSLLAHEFLHLINFNQKERINGIQEETWLNEGRAEYAPTFLGYDAKFEGSYLEKRVKIFISNPSNSITEWQGEEGDYGVLNVFIQYLVEKYGLKTLTDSLKSKETGIKSLNSALKNNGFSDDFSAIFTNFLITLSVNNCSFGENYCFKNESLKQLRAAPSIIFIPFSSESTLLTTYLIKEWSGNWYKIVGGNDGLKIEFTGSSEVKFKAPYLVEDNKGNLSINFLQLNDAQKGEISIPNFGESNLSVLLIPSIQSKASGFTSQEPFYTFSWKISTTKSADKEAELIKELLAKIDFLKKEIARVQAQIAAMTNKNQTETCQRIENNLYLGLVQNEEVRCLQNFLKNQGAEIYPEGMVTGNFGFLTQTAVIRFQEKYAQEILTPLGLGKGTGYVGAGTKAVINRIIGG